MKRNLYFAFIAILLLFTTACDSHRHHRHVRDPIYQYRVHDDATDTWLYYYILFSNSGNNYNSYNTSTHYYTSSPASSRGGCPCYTYSSPTPVTNFSSVQMTKTDTLPQAVEKEVEAETNPQAVGDIEQLPTEEVGQITEQLELPLEPVEAAAGGSSTNNAVEENNESNSASESAGESAGSSGGDAGGGGGDGGGGGGD